MQFNTNNFLRFFLVSAALLVANVDSQNPCDYCNTVEAGLSTQCVDDSDIVSKIAARDSSCGRNWDAFCVVEYNDCYNQACGADKQSLVDSIAETGGPGGRPINRTQILLNCPPSTPRPTVRPTPPEETSISPTACPTQGKGYGKGGKKGGKKSGYYKDSDYYSGCDCEKKLAPVNCGSNGFNDIIFDNQCLATCDGFSSKECFPIVLNAKDVGKGQGYYSGKKGYYGGKGGKNGKKGYYGGKGGKGGKKGGKKGYYSSYYCECVDDYYDDDYYGGKNGKKGGKKGYYGKGGKGGKGGKKGYYGGKKGGKKGGKCGKAGKKGGKKGYYGKGGKGGKKGYYEKPVEGGNRNSGCDGVVCTTRFKPVTCGPSNEVFSNQCLANCNGFSVNECRLTTLPDILSAADPLP